MEYVRIGFIDDDETHVNMVSDMFVKIINEKQLNVLIEFDKFTSQKKIIKSHKECSFDIVFSDIEMPELDGYNLVKTLKVINPDVKIIFVTSHKDEIKTAFLLNEADGFIDKGVPKDYRINIDKVFRKYEKRSLPDIIKEIDAVSVHITNLLYCRYGYNDVELHMNDGSKIHLNQTLDGLEKMLNGCYFYRIHKNTLVNMLHVTHIEKRTATLSNAEKIDIARDRYKEFEHELALFKSKQKRNDLKYSDCVE